MIEGFEATEKLSDLPEKPKKNFRRQSPKGGSWNKNKRPNNNNRNNNNSNRGR
jgi:hypothetical protein